MLAHELAKALAARGVGSFLASRADCDISDPAQVSRLFKTHRPSLLLNCAAHTGVDLCEDEPDRGEFDQWDGGWALGRLIKGVWHQVYPF